jgi:hypothetical protein
MRRIGIDNMQRFPNNSSLDGLSAFTSILPNIPQDTAPDASRRVARLASIRYHV